MNNAYKHQEQILVQTSTFNSEQQPYVDILVKPEWENRDKVSYSQSIVSNYNHAYHSYYYSHHYINIFNRCNVQK